MPNRLKFIVALLFLVGCGSDTRSDPDPSEWVAWNTVIPEHQKAEATKLLIELAAANPQWSITRVSNTIHGIYGVPTIGIQSNKKRVWVFVPYNKCGSQQKRLCDKYLEGR